ncbi:hypothetical protein ACYSNW_04030 [Enterococcus sp. LJL99]
MDYENIKTKLVNSAPQTFLTAVLDSSETDDFFTFSPTINSQFKKNCGFLASEETISESDLLSWQNEDFLVVAQTIDGDYIAGTKKETMIIPASLYRSDIESFDLPLCDFFIAYYKGKITSTILPEN